MLPLQLYPAVTDTACIANGQPMISMYGPHSHIIAITPFPILVHLENESCAVRWLGANYMFTSLGFGSETVVTFKELANALPLLVRCLFLEGDLHTTTVDVNWREMEKGIDELMWRSCA